MSCSSLSFTTPTSLGDGCLSLHWNHPQPNIREKWRRSWVKMLADPLCWAAPTFKGPDQEDCCQHINHSTIMCFPQELLTKYIWSWARHMAVIFYNQLKMKMFWSETVMIIGRWSTTAILVTLSQEARASQLRCWKYISLRVSPDNRPKKQSSIICWHFYTFTQREDIENNFVGSVVSEGGGRLWKKCPKKCRKNREWEHCWIICSEIKDLCKKLKCQFFRWSSPRSEADSGVSQQIDLHSNSLVTAHNIQHKLTFTF